MKWSRIAVSAVVLLAAAPLRAGNTTYEIRPTYTSVTFTVMKWMVMKQEGTFREFQGTLDYDPQRPEASHIDMTVQAGSIDTRTPGRDNVLRSDDFLDVDRYPVLTFRSTEVKRRGANVLEVTGDFTLHGITRRITVPVAVAGTQRVPHVGVLVGFETRFTINRRDYDVLGARWSAQSIPGAIGDQVEIHILAGAVRRE